MARGYDFVVIGAGIIGASAAYWLKRKGIDRVLLIDRGGPAAGGTGKARARRSSGPFTASR